MTRTLKIAALSAFLAVSLLGGTVWSRGFGGGGVRGGGFGGGGFRGGYGGGSFNRTPSFSSARSFERPGGMSYGNRGGMEGMRGGQLQYGSRSGTYEGRGGGSINYGAAGAVGRGPGGAMAGRGVEGARVTTPGGRTFTDVNRAGGVVGPRGNAFVGHENFAGAYRPHGFNAYGGYHSGWVHGYWNGHNNAAWGWRNPYWGGWGLGIGMGLGMGLGWGLSSWGFGSMLYGMGYMPYANPYYVADPAVSAPYNYSQPIDTTSAPADDSVANPATTLFDAGRASFLQGNYADALQQTDNALAQLPNDTTLHEFRALCLFALSRYDEAAATLYAVLAVGPGWDWTTLIGLYPNVDVYTTQLRALETYCQAHPDSAQSRFVLAYHYLTQGHTDAAVGILKQVVALNPNDTLSAKLLRQLNAPPDQPTSNAAAPAPAAAPADTTPPEGATIAGTWTANPVPDTAITLTIEPAGKFTWNVNQKGRTQQFSGTSNFGAGILTLAQASGPALVGRVSWTDASHITFRIVGDGPDDPGLSFAK